MIFHIKHPNKDIRTVCWAVNVSALHYLKSQDDETSVQLASDRLRRHRKESPVTETESN